MARRNSSICSRHVQLLAFNYSFRFHINSWKRTHRMLQLPPAASILPGQRLSSAPPTSSSTFERPFMLQAEEMAASKGIELPEDFRAAAGPEGGGLRRSALEGYFKLAGGGWLTSLLVRSLPAFRNRLLADRLFFFKVAAEVMIDSGEVGVSQKAAPMAQQH
jgi:hypothetical protein